MADPFGAPLPAQFTFGQPSYRAGYGGHGDWNNAPSQQTSTAYEDELPLLEELGIDLGAILRKSRSVLMGRMGADSLQDIDMAGPLLFATCLASLHLLGGKLHFGVILGWSAVSSTLFWFIVNQLAGDAHGGNKECIDLYNCCSCLGYCLLPMVIINAVAIFLPHSSSIVTGMFTVVSVYCAFLAGKLVTKRAPFLSDQMYTIAFPAFLYYVTLALISLY